MDVAMKTKTISNHKIRNMRRDEGVISAESKHVTKKVLVRIES